MTKIIGITGGIGTGKSTVAEYLKNLGYTVMDADKIGREVSKSPEVIKEVRDRFGKEYVDGEKLDRKAIAELIFSDPTKKRVFESIVTKKILDRVRLKIGEYRTCDREAVVFLDAPTLFETGAESMVDEIWVVTADKDKRVERAVARDGCSTEEIMRRMNNQMPEQEKIAKSDVVIDNSQDISSLFRRLERILQDLA